MQRGITYVNPVGKRIFGADRGEKLIGRDIIDLIDPEWQAIFQQRFAQATLGAQMNIDKIGIVKQDGSHVNVDLYLAPVFWNKGSAIQIVVKKT
jgi:PAS domain S-box-containing protein